MSIKSRLSVIVGRGVESASSPANPDPQKEHKPPADNAAAACMVEDALSEDATATDDPHFRHFWNDVGFQLRRHKKLRHVRVLSSLAASEARKASSQDEMTSRRLLNPDGEIKGRWDWIVMTLIAYTVVSLPFRVAFDPGYENIFYALEIIVSIVFVLDIALAFNTAVKNEVTEIFVTDRSQIAVIYGRLWLWVDVAATVPIDVIVAAANPSLSSSDIALLRLLRLFRVFKLLKINKMYSMTNLQSTALVFLIILFLCHIFGCFWFFIGVRGIDGPFLSDSIPRTWLELAHQNGIVDDGYGTSDMYVLSFYWASTTMLTIGYGELHAVNNGERVYNIATMLVGAITLGSLVDQVVKLIESLNVEAQADRNRLAEFTLYLQESGRVPAPVKMRALRAYKYYLRKKSTFLEEATFSSMPPVVLNKLVVNLHGPTIKKILLFQQMLQLAEKDFIVNLIMASKPFEATPGELISEAGDLAIDVVFIVTGEVRVWSKEGAVRITEGFASHGNYFGDFEFYGRSTRVANYSASKNCKLLSVSIAELERLSSVYEEAGAFFRRMSRVRYKAFVSSTSEPVMKNGDGLPRIDGSGYCVRTHLWLNGAKVQHDKADHSSGAEEDAKERRRYTLVRVNDAAGDKTFLDLTPVDLLMTHRMIHPAATLKILFDILVAMFVVFSMFVVPVDVAFQQRSVGTWLVVKTAVDGVFLLDCLCSFRTVYFDEELQADVAEWRMVGLRYIKGWFILDLVSSIPWDIIQKDLIDDSVEGNTTLFMIFNLLRLLKLFRILRLGIYFDMLEEYFSMSPTVTSLMKLFFKIFSICHIVACIWWGLSSVMPGESWIDNSGMVYDESLREGRLESQYITSLYWAFTTLTTLGYGDIIPLSTPGRVLTIVLEIFGSAVFGYILASVGVIFENAAPAEARLHLILNGAHEYLLENGVPKAVNDLVLKHLRLKFDQSSIFDEDKMLSCLPTKLSDEIYMMNRLSKLKRIPVFDYITNRSIAVYLYKKLRPCYYDGNEYVLREGEHVNAIKFLVSGDCVVFKKKRNQEGLDLLAMFFKQKMESNATAEKGKKVRKRTFDPSELQIEHTMPSPDMIDFLGTMHPGNFFGQVSMLNETRYNYSVFTTEPCCFYELRKETIVDIVRKYPDVGFALKTCFIEAIHKQRGEVKKQFRREKRFHFLKQLRADSKARVKLRLPVKSTLLAAVQNKSAEFGIFLPNNDEDSLRITEAQKRSVKKAVAKWRKYRQPRVVPIVNEVLLAQQGEKNNSDNNIENLEEKVVNDESSNPLLSRRYQLAEHKDLDTEEIEKEKLSLHTRLIVHQQSRKYITSNIMKERRQSVIDKSAGHKVARPILEMIHSMHREEKNILDDDEMCDYMSDDGDSPPEKMQLRRYYSSPHIADLDDEEAPLLARERSNSR